VAHSDFLYFHLFYIYFWQVLASPNHAHAQLRRGAEAVGGHGAQNCFEGGAVTCKGVQGEEGVVGVAVQEAHLEVRQESRHARMLLEEGGVQPFQHSGAQGEAEVLLEERGGHHRLQAGHGGGEGQRLGAQQRQSRGGEQAPQGGGRGG
jgi:hypothetical protein